MEYVKGCEVFGLSRYTMKKIADGKIEIADGLKDVLSKDRLSDLFNEAMTDFVNGSGKTIKGMPSGEIHVMTKKIEKKKYIIGLSYNKRIAGEPSGKRGIEAWLEESRDTSVEAARYFAEGFEKELAYFDYAMIDHFKNSVGAGQLREAEYQDKIITRVKSKKILGITISQTALFILMIVVWGILFKNLAIGICFALCFVGSFAMVTNKAKSEEKTVES